jgi:hypothetical protein
MQEIGLDPLSDAALAEVRAQYLTLSRKATRRGSIAAASGIALLIMLLASGKQLLMGGADYLVVGGVSIVLLLGLLGGWVAAARTLRARKAAVRDSTEGYERVVSAVFKSGEISQREK